MLEEISQRLVDSLSRIITLSNLANMGMLVAGVIVIGFAWSKLRQWREKEHERT